MENEGQVMHLYIHTYAHFLISALQRGQMTNTSKNGKMNMLIEIPYAHILPHTTNLILWKYFAV